MSTENTSKANTSDVFCSCYCSRRGSDWPTPLRIIQSPTKLAGNRWWLFVAFCVWKINEGSRVWEASLQSYVSPAGVRGWNLAGGRFVSLQSKRGCSELSWTTTWGSIPLIVHLYHTSTCALQRFSQLMWATLVENRPFTAMQRLTLL